MQNLIFSLKKMSPNGKTDTLFPDNKGGAGNPRTDSNRRNPEHSIFVINLVKNRFIAELVFARVFRPCRVH